MERNKLLRFRRTSSFSRNASKRMAARYRVYHGHEDILTRRERNGASFPIDRGHYSLSGIFSRRCIFSMWECHSGDPGRCNPVTTYLYLQRKNRSASVSELVT